MPSQMTYTRWREVLRDERLPAVVVDLDAFDRNVRAMAELVAPSGHTLRLATKSVRVPALVQRALDFGSPFEGLMCFSAEELEWYAEQGQRDLLLAYPTVRAADIAALRRAAEAGAEVAVVVDSVAHATVLDAGLAGSGCTVDAVIEVDVSLRLLSGRAHLGVRRSPVRTHEDLTRLLSGLAGLEHVRVGGAMAYEAQVAGLGDSNPFKRTMNPAFRAVRGVSMPRIARTREWVREAFEQAGLEMRIFNGGGTGSLNWAVQEASLTEVTAGSGLLSSHLFDYYRNIQFEPACFFALQTVRQPDPGWLTCLGGGYVASGEPGWDKVPVPWLPEGAKLSPTEGTGEVQTPLRVPAAPVLAVGDPVLFRHAKAGELAERFSHYLLVSDGEIVERVPSYRGLGLCFF